MYKQMETRWEGELAGRPQQIWDGFTHHAAAWIWEIAYEPRVGGAERGLTSAGGTVTVWEPPRHFRTEARRPDGWFNNSLDYTLDGTHLSYVHTCAMEPSEFDVQYDACIQHTRFYYHSLGEYLRHFAGRDAALPRPRRGARLDRRRPRPRSASRTPPARRPGRARRRRLPRRDDRRHPHARTRCCASTGATSGAGRSASPCTRSTAPADEQRWRELLSEGGGLMPQYAVLIFGGRARRRSCRRR